VHRGRLIYVSRYGSARTPTEHRSLIALQHVTEATAIEHQWRHHQPKKTLSQRLLLQYERMNENVNDVELRQVVYVEYRVAQKRKP